MQYALNFFPNGGPWGDARTLAELARLAEESGCDGVFLEDYIVWQSNQDVPSHDRWIILAAMAMHTNHIRLGTMVTPLARRRPWKMARETITLDHLSNARIILGIGLGDTDESVGSDVSFTHFGEVMDARQRSRMLDEALESLRPAPSWLAGRLRHLRGRKPAAARLGGRARLNPLPGRSRCNLVGGIYSARHGRFGRGAGMHQTGTAARCLVGTNDYVNR